MRCARYAVATIVTVIALLSLCIRSSPWTARLRLRGFFLHYRDWRERTTNCFDAIVIRAYCGGVFREAALEREHVIPTSRGGTDTWTNVVSACRACNQLKAAKTPEEARMPLLYVPYVPSRWEDMILQARADHIVADQMAFLRESLPKGSRLIWMDVSLPLSSKKQFFALSGDA
jgi:5-methylcytosine-specific restriction endonuclease McrA